MGSPKVANVLTKLQCCPTSDGAAAAIVASEDFVRDNNLMDQVGILYKFVRFCFIMTKN